MSGVYSEFRSFALAAALRGSAQNHDGQGRCGPYDLERWPKRPRGSCTSSGLVGSSIRCDQTSRVQLHEQVTSHPGCSDMLNP